MSMTVKTFDQILADMKARNVSNLDTSEGSFVDAVLRPIAYALAAWNFDLATLAAAVAPDSATGVWLEHQAAAYGLARHPGQFATAEVIFQGVDGTSIPKGTAVQTTDGLVFMTTTEAVVSDGTATVQVSAEAAGNIYNVAAGTIRIMQSFSRVTILASSAASGGADPESDNSLRSRLATVRQKTPASCNVAQYELWAMEVPGVGRVRVNGRWNGPGTVRLCLLNDKMQPADSLLVQAVQAHIDPLREICTEVTCVPAVSVNVNISAEVVLDSSISAEQVHTEFVSLMDAYFSDIALSGSPVVYNRIAYMLLSIKGVIDYTSLIVNGGQSNIAVADDAAPVVGAVTVE